MLWHNESKGKLILKVVFSPCSLISGRQIWSTNEKKEHYIFVETRLILYPKIYMKLSRTETKLYRCFLSLSRFPLSPSAFPSLSHLILLSIYRIPLFFHLISPFLCFSHFFSSSFFSFSSLPIISFSSLLFPILYHLFIFPSITFLPSLFLFYPIIRSDILFRSFSDLLPFRYVSLFTFLPLPLSSYILFLYFHSPTLHLFLPTHSPHQFPHYLVCHKGLFAYHSLFVGTSNLYFSFLKIYLRIYFWLDILIISNDTLIWNDIPFFFYFSLNSMYLVYRSVHSIKLNKENMCSPSRVRNQRLARCVLDHSETMNIVKVLFTHLRKAYTLVVEHSQASPIILWFVLHCFK